MTLRVFGVPVRVHALLPLLGLLAAQMDLSREALAMLPALFGHEAAHVLCAAACGMQIRELELTPLGAAARMDNPWNASAPRIFLTAMAGPAANAGMICLWACAAYAGWIGPEGARRLIGANVLLLFANLLPALPLDGGRALCAALAPRIGVGKAVRVGVRLGYALALVLAGGAVWLGCARRVWNISLFAAAAYLAACASREILSAAGVSAEGLAFRREELLRRGSLPVREIALREDMPLARALSQIRPGAVHVLRLYDDAMRPAGVLQEADLLSAFPAAADQPLSQLLLRQKDARPQRAGADPSGSSMET